MSLSGSIGSIQATEHDFATKCLQQTNLLPKHLIRNNLVKQVKLRAEVQDWHYQIWKERCRSETDFCRLVHLTAMNISNLDEDGG